MAQDPQFSRKAFQEWKEARVNRPFLRFLRDNRAALAEQWASGVEMDSRQQCKALLMGELADLEWSDIEAFYALPTDETESDPQ